MDLTQIRTLFSKASLGSKSTELLFQELDKSPEPPPPIVQGYRGAAWAMRANHTLNPFYKLNYIQKAATLLSQAIRLDSENPELRFLRFAIELNTPSLLGLNAHLREDRAKIVQVIQESPVNPEMKTVIARFLLDSKTCNDSETKILVDFLED